MVTGLGGIFIKANDPRFLARWYEDNLGIGFGTSVYFSFKWREPSDRAAISHTVFSFFESDTSYFFPGTNDVMLNLRVNNLDDLRIQLKNDGTQVIDKVENYEYGRFGWAIDPVGNKIELWEPNDDGFEDRNKPMNLTGVTGLGGIYLKSPMTEDLKNWYAKHFGFDFSANGHSFQWQDLNDEKPGSTLLSFYPENTSYFSPSDKTYMLSFRVDNTEKIIHALRDTDAIIIGDVLKFSHGTFGWFTDPEGNKVELWQPNN